MRSETIWSGRLNRDGNLDIAVVHGTTTSNLNGWGNQVTILLGDGRGGFLEPVFAFTTGGSDVTVATGDFDEDGRPDLAIGSLDAGAVYIHLGNGDGSSLIPLLSLRGPHTFLPATAPTWFMWQTLTTTITQT